ncbi:hypothetical protein Acr_04g0002690 [Actinidia rufa]|uniref:Uncharacterized protein n=1 Tax=Actinidia rufa TaxID=165716 RepID=A0A7J0EGF3_9ERIC|nr:hypothetical protein Acr_04g0002690 [Actinidia rufa]
MSSFGSLSVALRLVRGGKSHLSKGCSSRRYKVPAPIASETESEYALTRRLIISERDPVSDTRPHARRRSHTLPCARGRTHAPVRTSRVLPHATTRLENGSRMATRKQGDAIGKERLEGYTDWRGVSRQGELLSDMGPVVLARRMDKGSNCCTEARKASAGVPRGFGAIQERKEMLWDMCGSLLCAQGKRDGATTTRKVTYFATNPSGGCMAPRSYGEAGPEAVRMDNLKTSDYPPGLTWMQKMILRLEGLYVDAEDDYKGVAKGRHGMNGTSRLKL